MPIWRGLRKAYAGWRASRRFFSYTEVMHTPLILYTFRRCPYAMRARMAMAYAGLTFEVREVVLRDKPPEMLTVSPKGTVPVLQVGDTVIDESLDVMRFALHQADPDHWLDVDRELWDWVSRCEDEFKPGLDCYKYHDRHPHSQKTYRGQCEGFLSALDRQLQHQSGTYVAGDRVSVIDVALFPFVRQFAHVDKPWFDQQPWLHL